MSRCDRIFLRLLIGIFLSLTVVGVWRYKETTSISLECRQKALDSVLLWHGQLALEVGSHSSLWQKASQKFPLQLLRTCSVVGENPDE